MVATDDGSRKGRREDRKLLGHGDHVLTMVRSVLSGGREKKQCRSLGYLVGYSELQHHCSRSM
jgi:hypothetical protein